MFRLHLAILNNTFSLPTQNSHFKICMLNPLFVKYRFQIPLFKCKICFISSATVLMTCADVPHTRSAGNVSSAHLSGLMFWLWFAVSVSLLCAVRGFRCHPHNTHNRAIHQHGKMRSLFAHCSPEPPAAVWKVHLQKSRVNETVKCWKNTSSWSISAPPILPKKALQTGLCAQRFHENSPHLPLVGQAVSPALSAFHWLS